MSRPPAEDKINDLVAAYRSRDYAGAERMARGFTRKWPQHDLGWNILSASLHARGKLERAAQAYQRAIALDPGNVRLLENYGALLLQRGAVEEAESKFRESLALNPESAGAHGNLAMALFLGKRFDEALASCRRAVALDPEDASALNTMGNVLKALDRPGEAIESYQAAIRSNPGYTKAHYNLAGALQARGNLEGAEEHYRLAVQHDPGYARARLALGNLLAMQGRLDEAERLYRETIDADPGMADAHRYLAWIKTFTAPDADFQRINEALSAPGLDHADRARLHYAAAKACQDMGDRDELAFRHFSKGAACRRRAYAYDVLDDEELFAHIARVFPDAPAAATTGLQEAPIRPVFIVGMPRCGSTLVEQILSRHSGVHAAGESAVLPGLVSDMDRRSGCTYPEWAAGPRHSETAELGDRYVQSFASAAAGHAAVTDKMLDNFKYLGLIASAMPQARIIHVRRSPLDTCVSCFTQYFSSAVPFSYDLVELARYYRAYHGLMGHWRRILPGDLLLEIDYESLVCEPGKEARRLVEFCGLPWEEGCLREVDSARLIETASVAQARQGVHERSVGRWRRYEVHLQPLVDTLADLAY